MRFIVLVFVALFSLECTYASTELKKNAISFKSDNILLVGTLVMPKGDGPFPGIVMVHGSGFGEQSDLMETAEGLAGEGMAVLVYDKRGSGKSGGNWITSSLSELVNDAVAAFKFLISQSEIKSKYSGFWGISQAGWVVPLAANKSSPAFIIIVTGGGVPPRNVETENYKSIVRRADNSDTAQNELDQILGAYFDYLIGNLTHQNLMDTFEKFRHRAWFDKVGIERVIPSEKNRSNWAWVADFNPEESIKELDIPVLVLLGGNDHLTPTRKTAEAWRTLLGSRISKNKVKVFPLAGHGLRRGHHAGGFVDNYFMTQIDWLDSIGIPLISSSKNDAVIIANVSDVSTEELRKHVYKLASDEFEGRGAGYEGERKAANYIADNFNSIGLLNHKFYEKKSDKYFQPFDFQTIDSKPWEILKSQNVLGILKGKEYPNEYIVVGGHYDGQGKKGQAILGRDLAEGVVTDLKAASKDEIWNSAVDNAVSISAIIEIARVLTRRNIHLSRSIIFTAFSAEESGLDGSTYFVNNPPVALKQIKAMVNLEKIIGDPDAEFLYVSYGTNPIFEDLRKKTDSLQEIKLKPFYPGMIANSDHYAFAQRKIPAITIGTGSSINVHTSLDHANRLDYPLLNDRTQYILRYLILLANSESLFEFTGDLSGLLGVSGGLATNAEKAQKGFDGEAAFKITSVVKDSQGYDAGLLPGDLIIGIDENPIKFQRFYQGLEDVIGETNKEKVSLKIIRENNKIEIDI